MPHPGFPTDMQPLMTALLTLAKGTSIVMSGTVESCQPAVIEKQSTMPV